MNVEILWTIRDWAAAVVKQPAAGPLPRRTVLVPHERAAHALRRELLRAGHTAALAGTRIVSTTTAAMEVLLAADLVVTADEERLRGVRLAAIFRSSIPLKHFPPDLLRDRPGWDEAFANTIGDLECGGLRPEDLAIPSPPDRLSDLAALWRAADLSAGMSWTTARILLEAARLLERTAGAWPFAGTVFAFAGVGETSAEARFVRAIPRVTLGLAAARPVRESYVARLRALFGDAAADAVTSTPAPKTAGSERNLLASFFFEAPPVLASPTRVRSDGPDGTVEIEEHAGVDAEVDAAAVWAARQIAAGTALEDIAILAPARDPLAGLLSDRLGRLPWPGSGRLPVYVEGGLPLTSVAAGGRALAVVRALGAHLSAGALADVLPALAVAADARHLSRGAAMDLAWSLGTVGGNAAHPAGALEWAARARVREADLAVALEAARADDDAGRQAQDLERRLVNLSAVRPALDALVALSSLVIDGVLLETLWPAVREFLTEWVRQPGTGPDVTRDLDGALTPLAADTVCRTLIGADALAVIERAIVSARLDPGRFGDPAVYVGTLAGAAGLTFAAVRVVGLSEGQMPSAMRDDPVLPDDARAALVAACATRPAVVTARDRALDDLHALDVVVRNASRHVALSTPRLDAARSEREPSSVILEAAAAIGRPSRRTGTHGATIPTQTALRRDFFVPAREADAAFRRQHPLDEAAWQDGVSRGQFSPPSSWRVSPALDPDRIEHLMRADEAGALDGLLGSEALIMDVPGLTAARPVSPSRLEPLLNCPHAFLLQEVLRFQMPAEAPPQREIGQPFYGSLFHGAVAECYRSFGESISTGQGALETWLDRADRIVARSFEEFLREYPLAGAAVRAQQQERLRRDVHDLLRYDWLLAAPGRRFVAVERAFGQDAPVELRLPTSGRALFVRGRIDRIDSNGETTLVRDLKTGRPHGRTGKEAGPTAAIDLQIAVYGLVVRARAADWHIPSRIAAAYVYLGRGRSDERSYREDFQEVLEPAAEGWLNLAGSLLEARLFPRTPESKDCEYCAFQAVCGDRANERAASLLDQVARGAIPTLDAGATRVLGAFAKSKGAAGGEGDDD